MEHSKDKINHDFVAGYVSAIGSFMIVNTPNGSKPVFQLKTAIENLDLLKSVAEHLKIKNKIYTYKYKKQKFILLIVRDQKTLRSISNDLKNKLAGKKSESFLSWSKLLS